MKKQMILFLMLVFSFSGVVSANSSNRGYSIQIKLKEAGCHEEIATLTRLHTVGLSSYFIYNLCKFVGSSPVDEKLNKKLEARILNDSFKSELIYALVVGLKAGAEVTRGLGVVAAITSWAQIELKNDIASIIDNNPSDPAVRLLLLPYAVAACALDFTADGLMFGVQSILNRYATEEDFDV